MPTPRRYANHALRQAAYRHRCADARKQELRAKCMPPLPPVATMPGLRRWQALTQQALRLLQTAQEEMQDYCDQRSDAWQDSERAETMNAHLDALENAVSAV